MSGEVGESSSYFYPRYHTSGSSGVYVFEQDIKCITFSTVPCLFYFPSLPNSRSGHRTRMRVSFVFCPHNPGSSSLMVSITSSGVRSDTFGAKYFRALTRPYYYRSLSHNVPIGHMIS